MRGYEFGPFRLDVSAHQLTNNGVPIELTSKAFDLLLTLVRHRDRLVPKQELMSTVWPDAFVSEGSLTQGIAVLRRVLGDDAIQPTYIGTISKHGYKFIAPAHEIPGEARDEQHGAERVARDATDDSERQSIVVPKTTASGSAAASRGVAVAAVLGLTAVAVAFAIGRASFVGRRSEIAVVPMQFVETAPVGTRLTSGAALSPDGRYVAFTAAERSTGKTRLWTRLLTSNESRPLNGTDGAYSPFWSPDSRRIGFFASGKLMSLDLSGASPRVIAAVDAGGGGGGSWGKGGVILYAGYGAGIYVVSEAGGTPRPATSLDPRLGETSHRYPSFLPDGRHFLYSIESAKPEHSGTFLGSIDSSEKTRLIAEEGGIYADPGFVLYVRDHVLTAHRFDPARRVLSDDTAVVATNVLERTIEPATDRSITASGTGVLSFQQGETSERLIWYDRSGNQVGVIEAPFALRNPAFTADNRQVLANGDATSEYRGLWSIDIERGTLTRIVADGRTAVPSPTGGDVVFVSNRGSGTADIYLRQGGRDEEQLLLKTGENKNVSDWSPDGRYLVYVAQGPSTKQVWDLWLLPMAGDRTPVPFLRSPFNAIQPRISPDGRRIAYASDESGTFEVYVQSFPVPGEKLAISFSGGAQPQWRRDGRELFYMAADGMLMSVDVTPAPWAVTKPKPLFRVPIGFWLRGRNSYVASADGQRFLVDAEEISGKTDAAATLLVNWTHALLPETGR
jgi:DNA-binding winged helix-turn-helix (wHTH) protein/Tol biopolymer transport system component